MAQNIDQFPLYDKLAKENGFMTDLWIDVMGNLFQTLIGYLSAGGIFIPRLTTKQRDDLIDVEEGQMIYLTDAIPGPPRTAQLQIWQVVADVGQWTVIV